MSKDLKIYGDGIPGLKTWYSTKIEQSPIPIHPHYSKLMSEKFEIGDLVQTCTGKLALIKEIEVQPIEQAMTIHGANNRYYKVMVDDREITYVGYSLKKI